MNFKRPSRQYWSYLKNKSRCAPIRKAQLISPDQIASKIVVLSMTPRDPKHKLYIKKELNNLSETARYSSELSQKINTEEITSAFRDMKNTKSRGLDVLMMISSVPTAMWSKNKELVGYCLLMHRKNRKLSKSF